MNLKRNMLGSTIMKRSCISVLFLFLLPGVICFRSDVNRLNSECRASGMDAYQFNLRVLYNLIEIESRDSIIIVLFDYSTESRASRYLGFLKCYLIDVDVINGTKFTDYVLEVSRSREGVYLYFITELQTEKIYSILQQVNNIDENGKKSTNIRHWSTWVIFLRKQDHRPIERLVKMYDNVALVFQEEQTNITPTIDVKTLIMTKENGMIFVPLDLYDRPTSLFPNWKFGYNRRHFKVISKAWPLIIEEEMKNGEPVFSGYLVDILDIISETLNFTYSIYHDKASGWNGYINGQWEGIFAKVESGEFDILASPSIITENKTKFLDYVFPAWYTDKIFPTYRRPRESSIWLYTKPYQSVVLYIIFVACAAFCAMFLLMEWLNPGKVKECASLKISITDKMFYITQVLLLQGGMIQIRTVTGRILLSSFWFFCVIMGSVYRANLVAFFAHKKPITPFSSIDDIVNSNYKIGMIGTSSIRDEFKGSKLPIHQKIYKKLESNSVLYPETVSNDNNVHISNVLKGDYVYLSGSLSTDILFTKHCDIDIYKFNLFDIYYSLAVPEYSPLKFDLEKVMSRLDDAGILKKHRDLWWPRKNETLCKAAMQSKPLHVQDIYSIFIVTSMCVGICFLVLVIEKFQK